jgi:hypothetical protein
MKMMINYYKKHLERYRVWVNHNQSSHKRSQVHSFLRHLGLNQVCLEEKKSRSNWLHFQLNCHQTLTLPPWVETQLWGTLTQYSQSRYCRDQSLNSSYWRSQKTHQRWKLCNSRKWKDLSKVVKEWKQMKINA